MVIESKPKPPNSTGKAKNRGTRISAEENKVSNIVQLAMAMMTGYVTSFRIDGGPSLQRLDWRENESPRSWEQSGKV